MSASVGEIWKLGCTTASDTSSRERATAMVRKLSAGRRRTARSSRGRDERGRSCPFLDQAAQRQARGHRQPGSEQEEHNSDEGHVKPNMW